jgi:hypothetical protein
MASRAALISKQVGKYQTRVFSFRGRPIRQVSTKAWHQALERSGIQDFRGHDLRHTCASWHLQNGTPLFALQELGGWKAQRWSGGTPISRPSILPRMRIDCAPCALRMILPMAR